MSARADTTAKPAAGIPPDAVAAASPAIAGRPRRAFAAGVCLAIALVFSLEASGGIASDGRRPTAVETMARVPAGDKRPTLRCWQYGRLVYEASDVHLIRDGNGNGNGDANGAEPTASAAAALAGPERPAAKGGERDGRRRVRLLDLNQGLCIID